MQSFAQWFLLIVFGLSFGAQLVVQAAKARGDVGETAVRIAGITCIFAFFFWLYYTAGTYSTIF